MSDDERSGLKSRSTRWEALAFIVDAQVALGRHRGYDEQTIRRSINLAFNEALDEDCYLKAFDLNRGGPSEMLTQVGMFRLVFEEWGMDRSNQIMQESWYAVAERAMERALQRTKSVRA